MVVLIGRRQPSSSEDITTKLLVATCIEVHAPIHVVKTISHFFTVLHQQLKHCSPGLSLS